MQGSSPQRSWRGALARADSTANDVTAAALRHDGGSSDPARAGIWKAAVPPAGSMHGEFDNNDPIGVVAGERICGRLLHQLGGSG